MTENKVKTMTNNVRGIILNSIRNYLEARKYINRPLPPYFKIIQNTGNIICRKCEDSINNGDRYVSRKTDKASSFYYHEECHNKTYH